MDPATLVKETQSEEEYRRRHGQAHLHHGEFHDGAGFAVPQSGLSRTWKSLQNISAGGFTKGLLITAALIVVVMGLVAGWMGANNALTVGKELVTLEGGLAAGITQGFKFLFSGAGLATLGVGAVTGAVLDARSKANDMSLAQAQEMAREQEALRNIQREHSVDRAPVQAPPAAQASPPVQQPAPQQAAPQTAAPKTSVQMRDELVKVNVIKEANFEAAELKRRTSELAVQR
jgi:hypothetical protein